jgi:hypothetical protein
MGVNEITADWLNLSAYLDGELSLREKGDLERRLRENPALRDNLRQLRITRAMLRSAPRKKVPHHFTLTPQMAAAYKKSIWLPLFSYASAVSAVIAVALLFVQFMPGIFMANQAAPAAAEMAMSAALESAPAAEVEIIFWGIPYAEGLGRGGGGEVFATSASGAEDYAKDSAVAGEAAPEEGEAIEESLPEIEAPAASAPETDLEEGALEEPEDSGLVDLQNDDALEQERTAPEESPPVLGAAPTGTLTYGELQNGALILGIRPPEEANRITIRQESLPTVPLAASEREPAGIPPVLSYAFIGLALAAGLAAIYLRRRGV